MTIKAREFDFENEGWEYIGKGFFNKVYRSTREHSIESDSGKVYTGLWVLKVPYIRSKKDMGYNHPERAVRKSNELSSEYPAFRIGENRWMVPWLGDTPATDEETATKVIEIYQRTRNIIGDACGKKNFLKFNGIVSCVDVDHAFKRGSIITDNNPFYNAEDIKYLDKRAKEGFPKTSLVIHTLGYLERCIPEDGINYGCITFNVLSKSNNYRIQKRRITGMALNLLILIDQIDPGNSLNNSYFTPVLINRLLDKYRLSDITLEILEKEIISLFLPTQLIELGYADGIQLHCKHHPEIVHERIEGLTYLHSAVKCGQEAIMHELIAAGADINALTPDDKNMLAFAIEHNRALAANKLVEAGADLSTLDQARRQRLFLLAAEQGLLDLMVRLKEMEPDIINTATSDNQTALIVAARQGRTAVVQYLIDNQAGTIIKNHYSGDNPEYRITPTDWAIHYGHRETALVLQNAGLAPGRPERLYAGSLRVLIRQGMLREVELLIHYNPDLLNRIDNLGLTPLHHAIIEEQKEIACALIKAGAKADIVSLMTPEDIAKVKCPNMTAWSMSIHARWVATTRALMETTIDCPIESDLERAIFFAIEHGLTPLVEKLVNTNPSLLNITDPQGQTPLSAAASYNSQAVICFLIKRGAELNQPCRIYPYEKACLLLDWAIKGGHMAIVELLQQHGAQSSERPEVSLEKIAGNRYSIFSAAASSSSTPVEAAPLVPSCSRDAVASTSNSPG